MAMNIIFSDINIRIPGYYGDPKWRHHKLVFFLEKLGVGRRNYLNRYSWTADAEL